MDFFLGSARTHELTSVIEKVCQRKANPVTLIRDILMKIQFTSRSFLSSLQLQLKLRSSLISVRSPYVRQIRPFAPPIKLLLSELIEVRIWTSFAKFMLIRRPGRSNGNLIVLESRSTFRETLTIRTGHMPAFCSTRPSWTRTSARWPAPARMKSASKQFPACSKSSWQVSTFDSPHNPQNVRLSSNHTPNFRNTQLRLPGESLRSHITHQWALRSSRIKQLVYRLLFRKVFTKYRLSRPGLPSTVRNCSINNQTLHSFEVQCLHGYDGGLPQIFLLELIASGKLR